MSEPTIWDVMKLERAVLSLRAVTNWTEERALAVVQYEYHSGDDPSVLATALRLQQQAAAGMLPKHLRS